MAKVDGVIIRENNGAEYKRLFRGAVAEALRKIGEASRAYAKQKCPVRTGNLQRSIDYDVDENAQEVSLGTNVHYAAYVELGTYKMRARPYLRPAMNDHLAEYARIIESCMKNG